MRRFFLPHPETHAKPHAFHPATFLACIAFFLSLHITMTVLSEMSPGVLGYATRLTREDVVRITNKERTTRGISPLKENEKLSRAAALKAADMMAYDYWAHISPQGREPWDFIGDVGYVYLVAGENLARNFEVTEDVIAAWLASPTHRENLLNERYQEIGIAVHNGVMNGIETTLVVQMFGTRLPSTIALAPTSERSVHVVEPGQARGDIPVLQSVSPPEGSSLRISPLLPRNVAIVVLSVLVSILVSDVVWLWRHRARHVRTHGVAHAMLFLFTIGVLWYTRAGNIL